MPALDGEILQPGDKPDPADEKTVLDGFWATFGKAAKRIPFAEDVVKALDALPQAEQDRAIAPPAPGRTTSALAEPLELIGAYHGGRPHDVSGHACSDSRSGLLAGKNQLGTFARPLHDHKTTAGRVR